MYVFLSWKDMYVQFMLNHVESCGTALSTLQSVCIPGLLSFREKNQNNKIGFFNKMMALILQRSESYMSMFLWLLDFVTPLNLFQNFSILAYNNTIISLRLIVYYLIIMNEGRSLCQAIYDSPLRDNCKMPNPGLLSLRHRNVLTNKRKV